MLPMELDGSGVHDCGHLRRSSQSAPYGHAAHGLSRDRSTKPTQCWWCRGQVFFHTNGHGDCVLFDALGWPWPIHSCWEERVRRQPHAYSRSKVLRELRSVGFKFSTYAPFQDRVSGAKPGEIAKTRGNVIENHYEKLEPKVAKYEIPGSQGAREFSSIDIADASERVFRFTIPVGEANWFPLEQVVIMRGVWWDDPVSNELLLVATSYRMDRAFRSRGLRPRVWQLPFSLSNTVKRSNSVRRAPPRQVRPIARPSLPNIAVLDSRIEDRPDLRALAMGMASIEEKSLEAWGRQMVVLLDSLAGRSLTNQRLRDQRNLLIRRLHMICVEREEGRSQLDHFFVFARNLLNLYRQPPRGRGGSSANYPNRRRKRRRRSERSKGREVAGLLLKALGARELDRGAEYSERFIGVGAVIAVARLQAEPGALEETVLVDRTLLGKVHWDSRWRVDSGSVAYRRFTYQTERFVLFIDREINRIFLIRTGQFESYW